MTNKCDMLRELKIISQHMPQKTFSDSLTREINFQLHNNQIFNEIFLCLCQLKFQCTRKILLHRKIIYMKLSTLIAFNAPTSASIVRVHFHDHSFLIVISCVFECIERHYCAYYVIMCNCGFRAIHFDMGHKELS